MALPWHNDFRRQVVEELERFYVWVRSNGYRPPKKGDLTPGAELLMVDVERFVERCQGISLATAPYTTVIRLDDDPVRPSNSNPDKEVVFYHCIMPPWDNQCFVPMESFCARGYREGMYENDTRWIIKA